MDLQRHKDALQRAGVIFESGLTQIEIRRLEARHGLTFPPDLNEFLAFALPVSPPFLDWRHASAQRIEEALGWPLDGICFDIEQNSFWLGEWGPRPKSLDDAFSIAKKAVESAPTLIPVYSHRYIPDRPNEPANPVFSVYQTDIIYYGSDLANYFEREFGNYFGQGEQVELGSIKRIEFWGRLAEWDI